MTPRVVMPGLLGLFALAGCDESDRFEPLKLDTSPNCAQASVEVLIPDLDRPEQPWSRVLAVALDEPGRLDFWALVEGARDSPDPRQLSMVHVRDGAVEHAVELAAFLPESTELELRPGPAAGSAWLVESGPAAFRVWQFEAVGTGVPPLRAVSPNLGWFPGDLARLCEGDDPVDPFEVQPALVPCDVTDWHRELAFVSGQPFLISTPPFSPNATMYVYAGRLRGDLGITEQTQLEFFRRCEEELIVPFDAGCEAEMNETTYPSLVVMGSQQDPSDAVHQQFIVRDRERDRVPVAREVVGLALGLDIEDKLQGFVFSRDLEEVTVALGSPSGLATDDVAAYFLHPVAEGGARVTRVRTDLSSDASADDRFEVLSGLDLQDPPEDLALLQIPGDVGLGWVEDGAWHVLKLFPDAPRSSKLTRYTPAAAVTSVQAAGRGGFLVFKDHDLGPDLVQLRCGGNDADE